MADLSEVEIDAIASRTAHHLSAEYKQLWIDREAHYQDHMWIGVERRRQEEVQQFRRKVANSVTIWAVILVIGFVAMASWRSVLDVIKQSVGN